MSTQSLFDSLSVQNKPLYTHDSTLRQEKQRLLAQDIPLQTIKDLSTSFDKGPVKPIAASSFTSGGTSCPDISSDISYTIRQFANLWVDSPAFSSVGLTTGFNSVQGAIAADKAYKRTQKAWKVGDMWGATEGFFDTLRGVTQSIGGMSYTALRPLSIAASLKGADTSSIQAATVLGKTTFLTGTIGNIFFGLFYFFMGACTGVNLFKIASFKRKLNKAQDLKEALPFLFKKLQVDPNKVYQKVLKEKNINKHLEEASVEAVADWLRSTVDDATLLKKAGMTFFGTYEERKAFVEKFFDEIEKTQPTDKNDFLNKLGLNQRDHKEIFEAAKNWNLFELNGLKQILNKAKLNKEIKVARATSGECLQLIKEAEESKLFERLTSYDKKIAAAAQQETQGILEKIKSAISRNLLINSAFFVSAVAGVLATILMFIFTGGIGALVVGALFLVVCAAMLIGDGYCLHLGLQDGVPGKHDKKLVAVNTVVCFLSIAVVIALMATGIVGLFLGSIALIIGLAWFVNNGYALMKLQRKEENYFASHPTLQSFFDLLQKAEETKNYERVSEIFRKLPKEEKTAIKDILEENTSKRIKKNRCFISFVEARFDKNYDFGENYLKEKLFDECIISSVEKCLRTNPSRELKQFFAYLTSKDQDHKEAIDCFYHLSEANKEAITKAIYISRTRNRYFKDIDAQKVQELKKAVEKRFEQIQLQTQEQNEKTAKYEQALHVILNRKQKSA